MALIANLHHKRQTWVYQNKDRWATYTAVKAAQNHKHIPVRLSQSAVNMTTSLITALLELILKRIGASFSISTLTTFAKIAIKILEACSTGKTACFETLVTGATVTDKMGYCVTSWKKMGSSVKRWSAHSFKPFRKEQIYFLQRKNEKNSKVGFFSEKCKIVFRVNSFPFVFDIKFATILKNRKMSQFAKINLNFLTSFIISEAVSETLLVFAFF